MTKHRLTSNTAAAAAAVLGGLALVVAGVIRLTDEQSGETTVVGIEHVHLAAFTVSLFALVPLTLLFGRLADRQRAATAAVTGQVVLGLLTVTSNVNGEDLGFFPAVAIPTNLLWFGGLVTLAIALRRNGAVPKAVAVGLPITWILTLPLSFVGGPIAAGAYWFAVSWGLRTGELPRAARRSADAYAAA